VKVSRRRFLSVVGALAAGGGVYGCLVEPTWLRVVEKEVPLRRLHPAFDGYRIVQLSDLHVGGAVGTPFLRRAVERATAFSRS
jgi:predicted MPP superfamily phosphohydrolase